MKATAGAPVQIISHFPERNRLIRENGAGYKAGETAEVWVRPFEILMLEVTSDEKAAESLPVRQISSPQAANLGVSLSLESIPQAGWMAMDYCTEWKAIYINYSDTGDLVRAQIDTVAQ